MSEAYLPLRPRVPKIFSSLTCASPHLLQRTIDLAPATDPATEMLCLCIDFGAGQKNSGQPTTLGQARKV